MSSISIDDTTVARGWGHVLYALAGMAACGKLRASVETNM